METGSSYPIKRFGGIALSLGAALGLVIAILCFTLTQAQRSSASAFPANVAVEVNSPAESTVITIGVAVDLSGPSGFLGWPVLNSVQLAVDQKNAAGGINIGGITHTLVLISQDSAAGVVCNPTQAITAAQTLIDDGASAVVGHTCSNQTADTLPVYNAVGMAVICPSCTGPWLTQQGFNNIFRTTAHDGSPAALLATHLSVYEGYTRTAIIEDPSWNVPAEAYEQTFTSLGGLITGRHVVTDTSYYTAALTAIQAENPQVIVNFLNTSQVEDIALLSKLAYEQGMTNVVIGWNTAGNDDSVLTVYSDTAGSAAAENDIAALKDRPYDEMPGWSVFLAAYQAASFPQFSDDPGIYGVYAYDAANIIIDAIQRSQSTDRSLIRQAIADMHHFSGVVGDFGGFDVNGDVIPQRGWLEQFQSGQWETLTPPIGILPIGLALDLSGGLAHQYGWPVANSVQLTVDQINASGGLDIGGNNYTVKLVRLDNAIMGNTCDSGQANNAAHTLIHAGARAVIGNTCSFQTLHTLPAYRAADIPIICPTCTVSSLTEQGFQNIFRTVTNDASPVAHLAEYLHDYAHLSQAAILDDPNYLLVGDTFAQKFTEFGGMITSRHTVMDTGVYTDTLTAIQAENPQVIVNFYSASAPDYEGVGKLSKIAVGLGMTETTIAWWSWTSEDWVWSTYLNGAGAAAAENDVVVMQHRRFADMPGWTTFLSEYQAAGFTNNPDDPGIYGVYARDEAGILFDAILSAQSLSPASIRDALAATQDYTGVMGTYEGFTDGGDAIPQWVWLARYQSGDWIVLHPTKVTLPTILK